MKGTNRFKAEEIRRLNSCLRKKQGALMATRIKIYLEKL
jgi:hypothetical protein